MEIKEERGQATVELAVMFPVILIIAVIAVNALSFFCECAAFDRCFKQMVSTQGVSPGYGKDAGNTKAILEQKLAEEFDKEFLDFEVAVYGVSGNLTCFEGTLNMHPTLFGMGLKSEIFGISLPTLTHKQQLTIDKYKPGAIV